jgi:hypothetical protein
VRDRLPGGVEDVDRAVVEVGGEDPRAGGRRRDRQALEHRAGAAASCVAAVPPFQPRMVPLSVAKMNAAPAAPTGNAPAVPLNTVPVGAPGTLTTSGSGFPMAL